MDCYGSAAVGRSGARLYPHSLQRLAPPILGAAFFLCCLASVKAAIGPATVMLDQVLKTDSTDLARGYLVVDSELLAAKVAGWTSASKVRWSRTRASFVRFARKRVTG
jgi:hypothetical protein